MLFAVSFENILQIGKKVVNYQVKVSVYLVVGILVFEVVGNLVFEAAGIPDILVGN